MRAFIFCLVSFILIFLSCHKDNHNNFINNDLNGNYLNTIQFDYTESLTTDSTLNIIFKVFKDDLDLIGSEGSLALDWNIMEASGNMLIDDTLVHYFSISIDTNYLNQIQYYIDPIDSNQIIFYNLFEEDTVIVNMSETKFSGVINKNDLRIDFNCFYDIDGQAVESRVFPIIGYWVVAGAVSVVTTVGTCAYERTAARKACMSERHACSRGCIRPCDYQYISGLCGGNCSVICPMSN